MPRRFHFPIETTVQDKRLGFLYFGSARFTIDKMKHFVDLQGLYPLQKWLVSLALIFVLDKC